MTSNPLQKPVQFVKGIGPALAGKLARLGVHTVEDLLYLLPNRYTDRRQICSVGQASPGKEQVVLGMVIRAGVSFMGRKKKKIFEAVIEDAAGQLTARWLHFHLPSLSKQLYTGATVLLVGDVQYFDHSLQMFHPEIEVVDGSGRPSDIAGKILPVYPLTEGLFQKTMRRILRNAWDSYLDHLKPSLPPALIEKYSLLDPWGAVSQLHFPAPDQDAEILNQRRSQAHRTLIFDEFFFMQLGLALKNKNRVAERGFSIPFHAGMFGRFEKLLPFQWTGAQKKALEEILSDMAKPSPMHRLLQGDVGSGKTVVAAAAALQAVAGHFQCALMAPTEILAEQHYLTLKPWCEALDIPVALLTHSTPESERKKSLPSVVIGTHALIQEGVMFEKLGLVIIDEQHRFGVLQRQALQKKGISPEGHRPHVLVMTATPIPRTLSMTLYGDLEVSILKELPKGRQPITTRLYGENQRELLYEGLRRELAQGRQAYVVYPLIEESEKIDLKNATEMSEHLKTVFEPEFPVALLHGRLSNEEKNGIMEQFRAKKIAILATTSVIEVGIDIPNATVMVIEHAERFGLSQLHQLRGRVGRGREASYCILMADYRRSEDAKKRLSIMLETQDGFRIAETDLAIRGPGEFLGTRQSGLPEFRVASLALDGEILAEARQAAFDLVAEDPTFTKPEHRKLPEIIHRRWQGRLGLSQVG